MAKETAVQQKGRKTGRKKHRYRLNKYSEKEKVEKRKKKKRESEKEKENHAVETSPGTQQKMSRCCDSDPLKNKTRKQERVVRDGGNPGPGRTMVRKAKERPINAASKNSRDGAKSTKGNKAKAEARTETENVFCRLP